MVHSSRRLARAALALALASLAAACAKEADDDGAAALDSAAAPGAAAPAPPPTSTLSDANIAAIVLAANAVDSAAGEQAKTSATNPQVKEFANRMVTDHSGVNRQAVELAGRLGLTPEDHPTARQLTQGGEQTRQQLSGLQGEQYDRSYIDHEVEYHETVLQAIDRDLIPNAQNAELRALIEQVRPAVQAHLDHARQLQQELAGS
jgi:putative membrane protein